MSPRYTRPISRGRPSFDEVRHHYAMAMREEFEKADDGVMAETCGTAGSPMSAATALCISQICIVLCRLCFCWVCLCLQCELCTTCTACILAAKKTPTAE